MNKNKTVTVAALAIVAGLVSTAGVSAGASAQEVHTFVFGNHNAGRSVSHTIPPLNVRVEIDQVGLSILGEPRSRICATFENVSMHDWNGGYRLTDRDERRTHASLSVPSRSSVRRCETLNPQMRYYVVLRRNASN